MVNNLWKWTKFWSMRFQDTAYALPPAKTTNITAAYWRMRSLHMIFACLYYTASRWSKVAHQNEQYNVHWIEAKHAIKNGSIIYIQFHSFKFCWNRFICMSTQKKEAFLAWTALTGCLRRRLMGPASSRFSHLIESERRLVFTSLHVACLPWSPGGPSDSNHPRNHSTFQGSSQRASNARPPAAEEGGGGVLGCGPPGETFWRRHRIFALARSRRLNACSCEAL